MWHLLEALTLSKSGRRPLALYDAICETRQEARTRASEASMARREARAFGKMMGGGGL